MTAYVVDTNVAVVANGRVDDAGVMCRQSAIRFLGRIIASGQIVIDQGGEMMRQYHTYCNPQGQPGVGDHFFREILMNYGRKVLRIELEQQDSSYVDFPTEPELQAFDLGDRVFAATKLQSKKPVLNATDTDWLNHLEALERNGIKVVFACGRAPEKWFA